MVQGTYDTLCTMQQNFWDESFGVYLGKKRSEGKHYNVALSHATKKLVRLIFAMEKSKQPYQPTV